MGAYGSGAYGAGAYSVGGGGTPDVLVDVPSSTIGALSNGVPGSGSGSPVTYTKTGSGILRYSAGAARASTFTETGRGIVVLNALGSRAPGGFQRVRWIGGQYDTAALVTNHKLGGVVTGHTTTGTIERHTIAAVITSHRLRGEDG